MNVPEEVGLATNQQTEVVPRSQTLVLKIHFLGVGVFLLEKILGTVREMR
jgi:hypothetical protein